MRIYLDDERTGPEGWLTIRPNDFPHYMETFHGDIKAISFDHDLGEGFPSGYDFFCEIEKAYHEDGIIPPMLYVHSANPAGRMNIVRGIESLNRSLGRQYNPQILPE
jgi:hypothetical protein